jgi:hypothetical protein
MHRIALQRILGKVSVVATYLSSYDLDITASSLKSLSLKLYLGKLLSPLQGLLAPTTQIPICIT